MMVLIRLCFWFLLSVVGRAKEDSDLVTVLGDRKAIIRVPETDRKHEFAVIVLHGTFEYAKDMVNLDFETQDPAPCAVAYAEMPEEGGYDWGYADDMPYFRKLLEILTENYCGRRGGVFVAGYSAGGTMALYLQNALAKEPLGRVLSGIGFVHAGIDPSWNPWQPQVPMIYVWNNNDDALAEWGGEQIWRDLWPLMISRSRCGHTKTDLKNSYANQASEFAHEFDYPSVCVIPTPPEYPSSIPMMIRESAWPRMRAVYYRSAEPTHAWPMSEKYGFGATEEMMKFFKMVSETVGTPESQAGSLGRRLQGGR